jgi:hypothetical protein
LQVRVASGVHRAPIETHWGLYVPRPIDFRVHDLDATGTPLGRGGSNGNAHGSLGIGRYGSIRENPCKRAVSANRRDRARTLAH